MKAYEEDSKRSDLSEPALQSLITRHQLALVDCEDANNNTPLSEAAGGGHVDTIKMLIQRGANLNSRGRYQRVPLWRAAFGGHIQAVQVWLVDKNKAMGALVISIPSGVGIGNGSPKGKVKEVYGR